MGTAISCSRGQIMGFENGLKTIVVATDLEGQAEAALEYARKLAAYYGARIVLAHGLDPMEYAAVDTVPGTVLSHMTEAGAQGVGRAGRRIDARGDSQPLRSAAGHSGGDAGGCGPAIRGRTDRDWHQRNGRRRTGRRWRHRRAPGAPGALPGDGGSRRLECGSAPAHSGRTGAAGDGAE